MRRKQIFRLFSSDARQQQEAYLTSRVCRPREGEEAQPASADSIAREQLFSQDTHPHHTEPFLRCNHTTLFPWPGKGRLWSLFRHQLQATDQRNKIKADHWFLKPLKKKKKKSYLTWNIKLHNYLCSNNIISTAAWMFQLHLSRR